MRAPWTALWDGLRLDTMARGVGVESSPPCVTVRESRHAGLERPPIFQPLAAYAKQLRGLDGAQRSKEAPRLSFPMYALPMEELMILTEARPHEELLELEIITIFDPSMGNAMFVSHQWVGKDHPDPSFHQLRVLQDAMKYVTSGGGYVSVDVVAEAVYGLSRGMSAKDFRVRPLLVWYDYFCCPQLEVKSIYGEAENGNLQKAIDSIPAYVARCAFFVVLCPAVEGSCAELYSHFTWATRGWCIVEQTVKEITAPVAGAASVIVVKSEKHLVMSPASIMAVPGEGEFTVEWDRLKIASILKQVLMDKLRAQLIRDDFVNYRFLLNEQYPRMRGLPFLPIDDFVPGFEPPYNYIDNLASAFLYQNGFTTALDRDRAGWSALCYAAVRGDPIIVKALLEKRGDPNDKVHGALGQVPKNTTLLGLCGYFKNNRSMAVLLAAKADVNSRAGGLAPPVVLAAYRDNPEGVAMLCKARADPRAANSFGQTALQHAASVGSLGALQVLLGQADDLDLSGSILWAVMFHGGSARVVIRLLEARADINEQFTPSLLSPLGILFRVKGWQHTKTNSTLLRTLGYHHFGATPLMVAILCGNFEAAAALLVAGADVNLQNSRLRRAADLAKEVDAPEYVMEALDGGLEKAEDLVALANGYVRRAF
ncbi:unnamed protein product [Effrenium voratum]|nr:unnamed protein product [Effrenium voratum]